jgi:hypothetical protein
VTGEELPGRQPEPHVPRVRCRHRRPGERLCTAYATAATATTSLPRCGKHAGEVETTPDGVPIVIAAHSHWRRLRWPDGTVRTVSAEAARRLGAIEQTTSD